MSDATEPVESAEEATPDRQHNPLGELGAMVAIMASEILSLAPVLEKIQRANEAYPEAGEDGIDMARRAVLMGYADAVASVIRPDCDVDDRRRLIDDLVWGYDCTIRRANRRSSVGGASPPITGQVMIGRTDSGGVSIRQGENEITVPREKLAAVLAALARTADPTHIVAGGGIHEAAAPPLTGE